MCTPPWSPKVVRIGPPRWCALAPKVVSKNDLMLMDNVYQFCSSHQNLLHMPRLSVKKRKLSELWQEKNHLDCEIEGNGGHSASENYFASVKVRKIERAIECCECSHCRAVRRNGRNPEESDSDESLSSFEFERTAQWEEMEKFAEEVDRQARKDRLPETLRLDYERSRMWQLDDDVATEDVWRQRRQARAEEEYRLEALIE